MTATPGCDRPDQPDRLTTAGLSSSPTATGEDSSLVLRRIRDGADVDLLGASISADGRYLTQIDWTGTGDVLVRDLTTGEVERVTWDGVWEPYQTAEDAAISPDGSQVAVLWYSDELAAYNFYEVRLVRRGERTARLLYRSEDCGYPELWGWSPNGDDVLFTGHMQDGTYRLVAVSAADGTVRTVADLHGTDPNEAAVSPDGRYAAYSAVEREDGNDRDISVLDLESGATAPLIRNPGDDFVLGWSPDGGHVLFASDRSGILGAWLQPMEDGEAAGDAMMLQADLWRVVPIGFTEAGSFLYGIPLDSRKVHIASIDPQTGSVLAPAAPVSGDRLAQEDHPTWSPDGRYLAYRSLVDFWGPGTSQGSVRIIIRSLATGETRELIPDLEVFGNFRWYPDGRRLLVDGQDRDGWGLFDVDIDTGEAEVREEFQGLTVTRLIDWGPGDRKLFYRIRRQTPPGADDPDWEPVTRPAVFDLDTGTETILYDGDIGYFPGLSPDGRQLAFAAEDGGAPALMVIPTSGGEPRVLVRFEGQDSIRGVEFVRGIAWSRDGRTLLFGRVGNSGAGVYRVPVSGGTPEPIELYPEGRHPGSGFRDLRLHPDGRRIAFDVGVSNAEIWVMEDFLPERAGDETDPRRR